MFRAIAYTSAVLVGLMAAGESFAKPRGGGGGRSGGYQKGSVQKASRDRGRSGDRYSDRGGRGRGDWCDRCDRDRCGRDRYCDRDGYCDRDRCGRDRWPDYDRYPDRDSDDDRYRSARVRR